MAKKAHITSQPGIEVGDRALGLCGKAFKVKVLWDDVPLDKPICRDCVDVALDAMSEADVLITKARVYAELVSLRMQRVVETLNPVDDDLMLDVIDENQRVFSELQREEREEAEELERLATTCTCVWSDAETREINPDCPIHGETVDYGDYPGVDDSVEPEEAPEQE